MAALKEVGGVPLRTWKELTDALSIWNVFECTIKTLLHSSGRGPCVGRRLR
jgi:hypothetical protein